MTGNSRGGANASYIRSALDHEYSATAPPWPMPVTNVVIDGVESPIVGETTVEAGERQETEVRVTGRLKVRFKVHRTSEIGTTPLREEIRVTRAATGGASGEVCAALSPDDAGALVASADFPGHLVRLVVELIARWMKNYGWSWFEPVVH